MRKWILAFLIALIIVLKPVFALEHLSKGDLKITVKGLKSSYSPGDKVNVTITIEPKNDDIARKMERREYDIYSYLKYPEETAIIYVANIPPVTNSSNSNKLIIPSYWLNPPEEEDILEKLVIKAVGYVPSVSENKGIVEFTYLKVEPQDGDVLYFNLTILNPSKLSGELNNLKNKVNGLENEVEKLSKYVSVENLKDELNKIKINLTLAEGYYNDHDYGKVSEKISWIDKAIKDLETKIRNRWAEYYIDTAKNTMNDIDALLLKAESYVDVAKSTGKAQQIIRYELNLTQIKFTLNDLRNNLNNLQELYDKGEYNETINNAKDLLNKERKIKLELSIIVTALKDIVSPSVTPTPTKASSFKFKLDEKMLMFIGLGAVIVIGGIGGAIALSKWRQKRKWDELR